MAGRRNHSSGDAGQTAGLITRRAALGAGLALPLPILAHAAPAALEIPIKVGPSGPWTNVWLNQQGPYPFLIRSDVSTFYVADTLAKPLGLELTAGEAAITGRAQDQRLARFYKAEEMVIGGVLPLRNMRLLSLNGEGDGDPEPDFPGSIPVPSDRTTGFYWSQERMRYSPDLPAEAVAGFGKVPLRPRGEREIGWAARVDCRLGGKPLRLTVSTGSPYALSLRPDAVKRLGLWEGQGPYYDRLSKIRGREAVTRIARRGDLELGGLRFKAPVVGLRDPRLAALVPNDYTDGTIGMDLLRRTDIVFDPPRNMSWVRPNAAMDSPWAHDRAGFQMVLQDKTWKLAQVDPASPAERAGLKAGDVVAVTNPDNARRIQLAQTAAAGTRIELPILREGARHRIAVVLEDRI